MSGFIISTSLAIAQVPQIIGDTNIDFCSVNEQFDPATGSWSTRAPMPVPPRINLAAAEVNGRIYVFGGQKPTSLYEFNASNPNATLAGVLEYDPNTDVWTTKADMPTARSNEAAAVINGKIYVVGGSAGPGVDYATLEVYDPSSNTWETKSPMLYPASGCAVGVIGGILYVAGGVGFQSSEVYPNVLQAYDPATDTWTRKSNMPTARIHAGGAVVNNAFYVVGGQSCNCDNGGGCNCVEVGTVESYDPGADAWSSKTPMNTPRAFFGAPQLLNGRLHVAGGFTNGSTEIGTSTDSVESYDPNSNTWTSETPLLTTRQSAGVASANGLMYVVGGTLPGAAVQGQQFLYQIVATNQPTTYNGTFNFSTIPGLSFDTTAGLLYGIVSTDLPENGALNSVFVFNAENAAGTSPDVGVHIRAYNPPAGPVIVSSSSATGRINQPFSFQMLAQNSSASTRYSIGSLPPGLSVDHDTGLISGTPTMAGNFVSPAIITDGTAKSVAYLQLSITADVDAPVITSAESAVLTPGQFFSITLTADAAASFSYIGADGVKHGEATSAGLPPGLSFDGVATISGVYDPPMASSRTTAMSAGSRVVSRSKTSKKGKTTAPVEFVRPNTITIRPPRLSTVQPIGVNSSGTGTKPLNFFQATTFSSWKQNYFSSDQLNDAAISGDLANPDHDQLCNLLEYAFNLDPTTPSSGNPLSVSSGSAYLSLIYTKSLAATDLIYTIEQSTDLVHWSPAPPVNQVVVDDGFSQTIEAQVARSDAGSAGNLYLRLRVSH